MCRSLWSCGVAPLLNRTGWDSFPLTCPYWDGVGKAGGPNPSACSLGMFVWLWFLSSELYQADAFHSEAEALLMSPRLNSEGEFIAQ